MHTRPILAVPFSSFDSPVSWNARGRYFDGVTWLTDNVVYLMRSLHLQVLCDSKLRSRGRRPAASTRNAMRVVVALPTRAVPADRAISLPQHGTCSAQTTLKDIPVTAQTPTLENQIIQLE